MNARVIVSKGNNPFQTAQSALQQIPFPSLRGRKVLVKPNAGRAASPGEGVTTHPSVVEATIDHLREMGATDIVIGESCIFGVDPEEAFRATGMREVSENKGVTLVDLDRFEPMEIPIPKGKAIKKIKVSSVLRQFD